MYSTCLFCNQSLGANEVVESFPVGRRLAFDQKRGRLWVVCRKCEKWNLTPLEERWDAIETCERLFRDTKKRMSTDNIGLARLPAGLDLVRIGEPQRPEFAAWRYGDQFGRRRRRNNILGGAGFLLAAAYAVSSFRSLVVGTSVITTIMATSYQLAQLGLMGGRAYRKRRTVTEINLGDDRWKVRGRFVSDLRLIPAETGDGWGIEIPIERGDERQRIAIYGGEARRVAALAIPVLTPYGGTPKDVLAAVRRLDDVGDPEKYLRWLARNPRTRREYSRPKDIITGQRVRPGTVVDTLGGHGLEACLAVEMAVNEENERLALEGELAVLEDAWKEAEEIAAIADRLTLPREVEEKLEKLKTSDL